MKLQERTYREMTINSSQLIIPRETYQRELNPERVRKIVKEFDERVANEPKVSCRNGKYYVFDGQHTLIQWAGIFLTQFSSVIFNLLAGLMFLLSVVGWLMGICTGAETMRMLAVGFVVFIIPHIAEWLIVRIAVINCNLRDFLKS